MREGFYIVSAEDEYNTFDFAFKELKEANRCFQEVAGRIHDDLASREDCPDDYLGSYYPSEDIYDGIACGDWDNWRDNGSEDAVCWEYRIYENSLKLRFYLVSAMYDDGVMNASEEYGHVTLRFVPLFETSDEAMEYNDDQDELRERLEEDYGVNDISYMDQIDVGPFDDMSVDSWQWDDGTYIGDHYN